MSLEPNKPGVLLPAFFLAAALSAWLFVGMRHQSGISAGISVCRLVYEKHYLGRQSLKPWFDRCVLGVRVAADMKSVLGFLDKSLSEIPTSHLRIYTPKQDEFVWTGMGSFNGLRFIGINGRIILWDIHADVSKEFPQLKRGLELKSVEGKPVLGIAGLDTIEGFFIFKDTNEKKIEYRATAKKLNTLEKPLLKKISSEHGYLKISSFRAEAFVDGWIDISKKLPEFKFLTIDLRGNYGGSFVALMRGLSPFLCGDHQAGMLYSPQASNDSEVLLEDNLEKDPLLDLIGAVKKVRLQRFDEYPCYNGQVRVLIDEDSRSVSEIFAGVLRGRPKVSIEGQTSSGEVLLAVWYQLEGFGPGYSVSIPEAVFESTSGERYEGLGVKPDKLLYYDLGQALRGKDSWL